MATQLSESELKPWAGARMLAIMGVPVFPCRSKSEWITVNGIKKERKEKSPYTPNGFQTASTDLDRIDAWEARHPDALIGTPTGHAFWVLDIDKSPAVEWFVAKRLEFNCARIQKTKRGWHLYFKVDGTPPTNQEGNLPKGVNVRGLGGYVIAWDLHGLAAEGAEREALNPAPAWLLELINAHGTPEPRQEAASMPEGADQLMLAEGKAGLSLGQIAQCLDCIDPNGLSYPVWTKVAMAVFFESDGSDVARQLLVDWSAQDSRYQAGSDDWIAEKWGTYNLDRNGLAVVGGNWLVKFAREQVGEAGKLPEATTIAMPESANPIADIEKQANAPSTKFAFVHAGDYAQRAPIEWIVKGVLPKAALVMVYGPSGSGKTFWVTDLLWHIARGKQWRGRRTKQARCAIVVAEGAGGYRNRVIANLMADDTVVGYDPPKNLLFTTDAPNMFEGADPKLLAAQIQAAGGTDILCIDTMAATTPGANENDAKDVNLIIQRCLWLHRATGAVILIVHHTGKDATRGARGSSALKGPLDAEIEIRRNIANVRTATITKMKDGEDGEAFHFTLRKMDIGEDADGDCVTSCVVEHLDSAPSIPGAPGQRLPEAGLPRLVMTTLHEHPSLEDDGLDFEVLITAVTQQLPEPDKGERDRRRDQIKRAITSCIEKGFSKIENGRVIIA